MIKISQELFLLLYCCVHSYVQESVLNNHTKFCLLLYLQYIYIVKYAGRNIRK